MATLILLATHASHLLVANDIVVVFVPRVEVLPLHVGEAILLARANHRALRLNEACLVRLVVLVLWRVRVGTVLEFLSCQRDLGLVGGLRDRQSVLVVVFGTSTKHDVTVGNSDSAVCLGCISLHLKISFRDHALLRNTIRPWHIRRGWHVTTMSD